MLSRFTGAALTVLILGGLFVGGPVFGQVILSEDFEFADQAAFEADWDAVGGFMDGSTGFLIPNTGIGLSVPNDNPPGIEGKGINISSQINEYVAAPISATPTDTKFVKLSADIFNDGGENKRTGVGIRHTAGAASNIIELGHWNANVFDPVNPTFDEFGAVINDQPTLGFAYRVVLFGAIGGDLVLEPSWQYFELDPVLDVTGTGGLPDGIVTPGDIGNGWHEYTATISPTSVTLTLDLFRDGLANSEATEGVGTAGVDATVTWEIEPAGGAANPDPFDNIRIGGASGVNSAQEAAIDNVLLELIDAPASGNADFDGDLLVDGGDFITWQRGFSIPAGTALPGDGDATGEGDVDGLDLDVWQSQFSGAPPLSGLSAVPEPSSIVLLALASLSLLARSRRCE